MFEMLPANDTKLPEPVKGGRRDRETEGVEDPPGQRKF